MKAFIEGFKTAQSLNEKKFSEDDLKKAWQEGVKAMKFNTHRDGTEFNSFEQFIQSLSQPKVFDVEAEMNDRCYCGATCEHKICVHESKPKITNNSIKIIKVL